MVLYAHKFSAALATKQYIGYEKGFRGSPIKNGLLGSDFARRRKGQKVLCCLFVCLSVCLSVTLLNGRDYDNDFVIIIVIIMFICQENNTRDAVTQNTQQWRGQVRQQSTYDCVLENRTQK